MSRRDWTLFVADMLEAYDGEASNGIPDEKKCLKTEVDWAAIKGLRNRNVHEYFGLLKRIQGIPTAATTCLHHLMR
jgi:hypothetical protein